MRLFCQLLRAKLFGEKILPSDLSRMWRVQIWLRLIILLHIDIRTVIKILHIFAKFEYNSFVAKTSILKAGEKLRHIKFLFGVKFSHSHLTYKMNISVNLKYNFDYITILSLLAFNWIWLLHSWYNLKAFTSPILLSRFSVLLWKRFHFDDGVK